jgi:ubiquinone biosynthesis protein COQ4
MSESESSARLNTPLEFRRAFRALRILIADPNDTAQVFTIIEALSGSAPRRMLERFHREDEGRRLLATRPRILELLGDRAALERMPQGSLAHAYLAFLDREGITATGLVAASVEGESGTWRDDEASEATFLFDRLRDTHDLWHAVTGYSGDVLGEAALLAFSAAQTRNAGVALIVLGAIARSRSFEVMRMLWKAFRDARRAAWLPATEWERLLPLPLDAVRAELRIEPVPAYVRMDPSWTWSRPLTTA